MHGNMELLSVELYLNPVNPKWPYKATWRTMIFISTVSLENQRKMTCPANGAYPEKNGHFLNVTTETFPASRKATEKPAKKVLESGQKL